jgi:hypothetical protein
MINNQLALSVQWFSNAITLWFLGPWQWTIFSIIICNPLFWI